MRAGILRLVAAIAGAALLWLVVSNGVAAGLANAGRYQSAVALAPDADRLSLWAQQLFFEHRFEEAIATARAALRISPLQTRAARVIGMAELALGRDDSGVDAMNAAALGGWRDNPTQLWIMQMALYGGDYDTAMRRADALIRRDMIPDRVFAAFRAMDANLAFRQSLIKRLDDQPDWRGLMFLDFRRAGQPEIPAIVDLIADLGATSRPATDLELFALVERLLELGDIAQAHRIWREKAPARGWSGDNQLYDGSFAVAKTREGIRSIPRFEWSIDPDATGLASVSAAPNGQGAVLRVSSDAGETATLAAQALALEPGRYAFSARIFARSDRDLAGFDVAMRCAPDNADIPIVDRRIRQLRLDQLGYSGIVEVPATCVRQDLTIRARGGTPVGATISIAEITLRRAA
jgi:tetratricopeptide (TPR) repeat protein